jgi:hypothetical protein
MSRGYGRVQRMIIAVLRKQDAASGVPLADIIGEVYYHCPRWPRAAWHERKEVVAVRRALGNLVATGVVVDLRQLFGDRARRYRIHYRHR